MLQIYNAHRLFRPSARSSCRPLTASLNGRGTVRDRMGITAIDRIRMPAHFNAGRHSWLFSFSASKNIRHLCQEYSNSQNSSHGPLRLRGTTRSNMQYHSVPFHFICLPVVLLVLSHIEFYFNQSRTKYSYSLTRGPKECFLNGL